ncbi:alpha/beta-hydrolase [Trichoderma citrinoviride]|uniref:Alpha/beta-hydrolase n=1 Tax=Trichoderma citrinoviride TaxID=58853 RepID=A0A2T4B0U7_9HYPO|nr:alpha/beta-hydrolase [Trichoderma citrinoviride]PTB62945.1 alpha/beta-hydrolase [Trichoderma citrinoviride]
MLSIEEIRALAEVNPEFAPILNSGSPLLASWDSTTNIPQVRAMIQAAKAPQPDPATLPYLQEDIRIPVRDGRTVAVRVYKPRAAAEEEQDSSSSSSPTAGGGGRPGLVVFHGGGYAVGDLDTETWLCALFVTQLGGVAVNVDYRLAPEHVFPAAVEDAFDATRWMAQNVQSLGIDPAKGFLVGGESSGADMALVVAHMYLHDGQQQSPPLTGVYAAIPGAVNNETVPDKCRDRFISLEQCAEAPVLSKASMEFIWKNHQVDPHSPLAFPLAFPSSVRASLPKTYFQICGLDPVRDCGLLPEQVFRDEGVETGRHVYPGMPHAFWALFPDLEVSARQRRDAEEGLRWLLS